MKDLTKRLADLSPEKRALLEKTLLLKRGGPAGGARTIGKRQSAEPPPLSFSQELMWLTDQLMTDRAAYNVIMPMRLKGPLNVNALESALRTIIERHEPLRTNFGHVSGDGADEPRQIIRGLFDFKLRIRAIPPLTERRREQEISRLCVEESREGFDLSRDLLLSALLLRVSAVDNVLVLRTHHIAFDGWSKTVLFRELEILYSAYSNGQASPLPDLAIQYSDFAVWQRDWLRGERMQRELAYWTEKLAGAPEMLELPADRLRPATPTHRGARQKTALLRPVMEPLKALRSSEETTVFMMLLAAFKILLHRYTGQDDIVVGTPVLGRMGLEVENLIGYFSNTVVLRTDLSGDPSYRELLVRVRKTVLDAFDHQELPLEKLVMVLKPDRLQSRTPLFQVLFGAGDTPLKPPNLNGIEINFLRFDRGIAKLDLIVGVTSGDNQMMDGCEYSTDLFDASTIRRLLNNFHVLLESIIENPDRPISQLPLLSYEERHGILVGWNDTAAEYPRHCTIHELFEQQALRTPDAIAVEFREDAMSYTELDVASNRLANLLRKRSVGPGVLVGLCMDRSLQMPVAMLGILKAGGAIVPLDPGYPADRMNFMLADSGVTMVLSQAALIERFSGKAPAVLCVDRTWSEIAAEPAHLVAGGATAEDLAYVIYTSGSTGTPNGVLLTHRGLVNHQTSAVKLFDLGPADRVAQFASISFDISLEEMFPAWISGATVVLRPDDLLAGATFGEWVTAERLTVLDLPASLWHDWTGELFTSTTAPPPSLRLLIVGGEKASADVFDKWKAIAPNVRWMNTYGPTETSVIVTAFEPDGAQSYRNLPIGRPLPNSRIYILDRQLEPVPVGVPGEIYIGGDNLARGYLNKPELTAQKFIEDPFSQDPQARLYKTADRARFLQDGTIEFLGRSDNQIKIRGFRVEPEEIEAVLRTCPGVRASVVLARADDFGRTSLVAYVVAEEASDLNANELRSFAKSRLPEYMVPSVFVEIDGIPHTPNGKIDATTLAALADSRPEETAELASPLTPLEQMVSEVWVEVLKRPQIGVHQNFFDLGGHSLLATQVVSRIRKNLGVNLGLRHLFEAPTIADLSQIVLRLFADESKAEESAECH